MLTTLLAAAVFATAPDSCVVSREFTVPAPAGHTIAAMLESRPGAVRQPAVVFISGAGAHTRDYSTAETEYEGNRAFVHLARQFVQAGFVVVRFDERGTGKSTGDSHAATALRSISAHRTNRCPSASRNRRTFRSVVCPRLDPSSFVFPSTVTHTCTSRSCTRSSSSTPTTIPVWMNRARVRLHSRNTSPT
jgi:hypothetical protein